jgi:hypothetical protein
VAPARLVVALAAAARMVLDQQPGGQATARAAMNDDSERELRQHAEARVQAREGFSVHFVVYLAVNALLWGIWAYSGANVSEAWPIFVTLGWGIGVVAHFWSVYINSDDRHDAAVEAELRKLRDRQR